MRSGLAFVYGSVRVRQHLELWNLGLKAASAWSCCSLWRCQCADISAYCECCAVNQVARTEEFHWHCRNELWIELAGLTTGVDGMIESVVVVHRG
jgi:hypothetical protein